MARHALTLKQGASAPLQAGLSISFDSVKESRCPQGVQCVWAGELIYHLSLHGKADEAFTLSDKAPRFASQAGLSIALANNNSPPLPIAGQPPPAYAVMLLINSN
jgi:hypothetical protein